MNFKNYFYLALTILSVGVFASCEDDDDKNEYPKTIETEKLLVDGKEGNIGFFYAPVSDTVYVIGSDKELFTFLDPRMDFSPEMKFETNVDYTKNSVLLVGGTATSGIQKIEVKYIQTDAKKYNLQVDVQLNETTEAPSWTQVLVVPKVDTETKINCITKYIL